MGCSFFSTVTPAQLPTFSFRPVSALNMVVLPLLGLPVNAILMLNFSSILYLFYYLSLKLSFANKSYLLLTDG